jgi:acylphosphatase
VGFRFSAIREAQRLGIQGWVKNAPNGDVEVWAEGQPDKLAVFFKWLHRGPQFSRVDGVDKEEKAPKGFKDFNVEY